MCGVAILSAPTLVINTLALAALVSKSKSSVNETLQKMQWAASAPTAADAGSLCELIACLAQQPDEPRHWTIRKWTIRQPANTEWPYAGDTQQSDDWEAGEWKFDECRRPANKYSPQGIPNHPLPTQHQITNPTSNHQQNIKSPIQHQITNQTSNHQQNIKSPTKHQITNPTSNHQPHLK
jgi:hypothetical protein